MGGGGSGHHPWQLWGHRVQAADDAALRAYHELSFVPFNPTDKRVLATVEGPQRPRLNLVPHTRVVAAQAAGGAAPRIRFRVAKGAPQVILRLCARTAELDTRVTASVQVRRDDGRGDSERAGAEGGFPASLDIHD